MYRNAYTSTCHNNTQAQTKFLAHTFAKSNATWKFLHLHHPYRSAAGNETDLEPLISIVEKHHGILMNGHDHCLGYFFSKDTNFILSGVARHPQAGDCNNGTAPGSYALYLAANNLTGECNGPESILVTCADDVVLPAANGVVTLDISKDMINVEYYARDAELDNGDLYPVDCDLKPATAFISRKRLQRNGSTRRGDARAADPWRGTGQETDHVTYKLSV